MAIPLKAAICRRVGAVGMALTLTVEEVGWWLW